MFDTHETLHEALTRSGTWSGLYTALMASTPPLAVRTHADHNGNQATGLEFFEQTPRIRNSPISGSITINLDSGVIILRADGYCGPRWHAALERLATDTNPWSWQPAPERKPGALAGLLRLGAHLTAETAIDRSSRHAETAHAGLALIPADRDVCETAWALAVTILGTLVTNDPAYRSTVLPAPDPAILTAPATDYPAAIATVVNSLAAIDDNPDFDTARDHDPNWPTHTEHTAVRALRDFRDALIDAEPNPSTTPEARAASLFTAAFNIVYEDDPRMTITLHMSSGSSLAVTGQLDNGRMRFHPAEVSTLLAWLTRAVATDPETIITVTADRDEDGTSAYGWAWCLATGAALDFKGSAPYFDDHVELRGAEFRHLTLDGPLVDTSTDGLSCTALTDEVKTVITAHSEPSHPAPGTTPARPTAP